MPNQGTLAFNSTGNNDEGMFLRSADNGYGVAASVKVNFREAKLAQISYEQKTVYCVKTFLSSLYYVHGVFWYHVFCHYAVNVSKTNMSICL